MAKQSIGLGSSANDGNGDTLRAAGTKINANTDEIYARFGSGTDLETATSANILVGNGTKFASVATSGDFNVSSAGAINVRTTGAVSKITIPSGSAPGTTTNALYNIGGSLYFNGSVVGTGNVTGMTAFSVNSNGSGSASTSITQGNTLNLNGGTGITAVSANNDVVTFSIDNTVVATLTDTQTLTGKSLTAPILTGSSSAAGSILFREDTDNGTNAVTLIGPAATADVTITLPASAGTVALTSDITVTAGSTTTFTNKTIDANGTGNSITNLEVADFAAASVVTQGEGIGSNNNDTTIPTSAAVKAYADSVGGGSITVQEEGSSLSTAATTLNFVGAGVTATGNSSTKTITIGAGVSTLAGMSDTAISSSAAGQTLLYDGSDSYDNKQIKVMEVSSAFTSALPLMFGANIFTISGAASGNYTFQNYNSNGSDQDDPNLYLLEDHTYVFYLGYNNSSHPFHLVTGGGSGVDGTNLTASNGGDNIVHIDTDGTVTTGVAYYSLGAASRGRGWLIWKIPHFGAHQGSSTGDYGYQCSQHNTMYGQIFISSMDVLVSHD